MGLHYLRSIKTKFTAKLICTFVFAYAKIRFSADAAYVSHVDIHTIETSARLAQFVACLRLRIRRFDSRVRQTLSL